MLIIPIKDGENIDRALKRFKRKFDRTGAMRQLRERKTFTKTSRQRGNINLQLSNKNIAPNMSFY
jgi:small subunit ribosomal protein S21